MKHFTLLAIVVGLVAMGISNRIATVAQFPARGLVGAWSFDEAGGVQMEDTSGHGHHGVLRGATRTAGRSGGAIECHQDALVEVPHAKALDDFQEGITVSAWINRTADTNWNTVISREIKDGWSEYFGLAVVRNKALFSVDGDGAHYQNIKSDEDVPVGEWIHLAGTYDNEEFKLYVNDRLVRSAPYTVPFKFADTNPLLIGGNSNSQGKSWVDCFHGRLDEVRLYNRALSVDEVAALASPQPAPSAGSLPTGPLPGDVFREYSWTTEKFHVFSLKTNRFALASDVDLQDAVRAEVVVELANQHMGFEGMTICLNGKQWYPIQFPASSPKDPSPSLWFHHWYPTIPIALTDLKQGTENTLEMKVPAECFDGRVHPNGKVTKEHPEGEWGWLPPWCPLYGLTVRVYHDPTRKPHPIGKMVTPPSQSTLGLSVDLTASAKSANGAIRQIDFIGRYEDINYEGDGIYDQWHGHLFHGQITHHLGSTAQPEGKVTWDTSWVPDQPGPMEIAARITDGTGLIYITDAVGGLRLVRPGWSVELCKPFDVPRSFTGCQYGEWVIPGIRSQKFTIKGDLSKAVDARYVIASWGNQKECPGYTMNGVALEEKPTGADYFYNLSTLPIRPLAALKAGENTFATVVAKGRMPDIYMPGMQVLVRYRTTELPHPFKLPSTSAPAARWRPQITNWSRSPNLVIGNWGFNRPGYPEGLYIHGITQPVGQKVTNPVIYDNDVYDDVFDDELAYVMASEGEMNLVGLIVTPVLTDFWGFSKPDWIMTAHDSRRNAEQSGLRMNRLPPITVGTEAPSEKAGENKDSAGARLYVRLINEQFVRDPQRPVIVNVGGQAATLASAYGLDPSIAHKCIVYYTDLRVYNGHYQWASKLIAAKFRVVSWGDDNWWITKPAQNQWRVLPRPEKAEGKGNDKNSGEWRQLTELRVPLLDHIVKQFQTRGEYCQGERKGDGYLDGTFIHAWLPGIFSDAALQEVRGSEVLHITRFTVENEKRVKEFALKTLLNPRAYHHPK